MSGKSDIVRIGPQPGPQTDFLYTTADICFFGGSAGGGKTSALLLDEVRGFEHKDYRSVTFRRTYPEISGPGGLWDESLKFYSQYVGAKPISARHDWEFPSGARIAYRHIQHEKDIYSYQGQQFVRIAFDQLEHFSERMFTYMLSRARTVSHKLKTWIRATLNPDPDHFARRWLDWYIGEDGLPIKERCGKLRYFVRVNDEIVWADEAQDLERYRIPPRSFTFIASRLEDNKILMAADPEYKSNLLALPMVERERLLGGNWNIRAQAGDYFDRKLVPMIDDEPTDIIRMVRFWDLAATEASKNNPDPDWSVGVLGGYRRDGTLCIIDVDRIRKNPGGVEDRIKAVAEHDGKGVMIGIWQDPGQAGKSQVSHIRRNVLPDYQVETIQASKDKETFFKPVAAMNERSQVCAVRAPWNRGYFATLEEFPAGKHDDDVDATSGLALLAPRNITATKAATRTISVPTYGGM